MDVRLTTEEGNLLMDILEERDRALLKKIAHARREAPRKALEKKGILLEKIIEKLEVERKEEESFSDLWW